MEPQPADRRRMLRPQVLLVAEDTDALRFLWRIWLGQLGFDVVEAKTGAEALAVAARHPPLAIVMDLAMPVMDGLEATRRLKANPATAQVPVVMLTAYTSEFYRRAAEEAGCVAFLPKPTDPADLIAELRRVLASA